MKKLHTVEITICPFSLTKQKQMLYSFLDEKQIEWTDEMHEGMDGLLNMLDAIEDQINDIVH